MAVAIAPAVAIRPLLSYGDVLLERLDKAYIKAGGYLIKALSVLIPVAVAFR